MKCLEKLVLTHINNTVPETVNQLLSWTLNTTTTVEKAQQRLYFIRLLRKAGLNYRPLTQAYRGLIKSILTTRLTVWYGNTTQAERKALQRVIKTAERIIGTKLPSMYVQRCQRRAEGINRDSLHPAHLLLRHKRCTYNLRHSRVDSIITHTTRFFNSFFPATVRLMTKQNCWIYVCVQHYLTSLYLCNMPLITSWTMRTRRLSFLSLSPHQPQNLYLLLINMYCSAHITTFCTARPYFIHLYFVLL